MIVYTDSTAGRSMAIRFGAGKKTKHVELRYFYMQDLVRTGVLIVRKVHTSANPADVLTKYSPTDVLKNFTPKLGIVDTSHSADLNETKQRLFHIACQVRFEEPQKS